MLTAGIRSTTPSGGAGRVECVSHRRADYSMGRCWWTPPTTP